jgi:hypothetical protein
LGFLVVLPIGKSGLNGEQQRSYQPQNQDHLFPTRSRALVRVVYCVGQGLALQWAMPTLTRRPQKITFGEMRSSGVRGLLIYCSDFHCSHSLAISADPWPNHVRLSDLEQRFVCKACGRLGTDVRPDFHWDKPPVAAMGYR